MSEKQVNTKKGMDPTIVVALIGVAGTVIVALITIFGNRPTPTPTPEPTKEVIATAIPFTPTVALTDTEAPVEPTFTPAPTDTPEPTPTFTALPPVAIGEDWKQGCISSLWKPYPANLTVVDKGDGCLQEPVHVFAADNGVLSFIGARDGSGSVEDYGLFAPLPESGLVTFTVVLKDLSNVDLWLGVFSDPDIKSNGLLLTIPAGNVKKRVVVQKNPFTYDTIQTTASLDQGAGFSFTFTFDTLSTTGSVNPFVFKTNPFPLATPNKWLFLGYRGLSGSYRIEGSISDLVIQ